MKIDGIGFTPKNDRDIELEQNEKIRLFVPASKGQTCVRLEVDSSGMLNIVGGSAIIGKIAGLGMWQKLG